MKRLYARLVLWLIQPALELKSSADQVVITQSIQAAKDAAASEIRTSMERGGEFSLRGRQPDSGWEPRGQCRCINCSPYHCPCQDERH